MDNSRLQQSGLKRFVMIALVSLLLIGIFAFPQQAIALTTAKAEAEPNNSAQTSVIGGEPTNVTWVGMLSANEEATALKLVFPDGTIISDQTSMSVTEVVLDDPSNPISTPVEFTSEISNAEISLSFAKPIKAGSQLHVSITAISFPAGGGTYYINGKYTDVAGSTHDLADKYDPIKVQPAYSAGSVALTTVAATAKLNDSSNSMVIGGEPTRITWTGNVSSNAEITGITFTFPEGTKVSDQTSVKVQEMIMDNPDKPGRATIDSTADISGTQVSLNLATPIHSGNQAYIEIFQISLPDDGGEFFITGSYTDGAGNVYNLEPNPAPIKVSKISQSERLVNLVNSQAWVEKWNSFKFLNIFVNPGWIVASIPVLFVGWLRSLMLVLIGFPLAIPIGLGISFLRMSQIGVLRAVSSLYVNVIRGTPLFLQIYIAFFGLPLMGIHLGGYTVGVLVLAINSSAYLAEIFRAGIQSINKGQFEASHSLGMNGFQTMFSVIIPQTVRRVIPTMTSEFILLYKDTSLLAAVGIMEQMTFAKSLVANSGFMTPYVVSAGFYLMITLPLTRIISIFEKKLAASDGRKEPPEDKKKKKVKEKRVGLF
ncbi:MAG: amino acid ABC transporter permease, partial [Coriobacteriales bacterium]|nr:amino acid ABC transporter permease [Coriobacteriales bacterium]